MEKHSRYTAAQANQDTEQEEALAVIQATLNPFRYDSFTWHSCAAGYHSFYNSQAPSLYR
jgi:hypothetical protein